MDRNRLRLTLALAVTAALLLLPCRARAQNANVTVDDQPTAEQRLEEVNQLSMAGRHDAAAELLQELIEDARFKLVGIGEGVYSDAENWCRERLLRDPRLSEAYRARYTATATRALEQAVAGGDRSQQLTEVYQRYTVTLPGLEAGLRLAGVLLEQGEAVAASLLIQELARHPDQESQRGRLVELRAAAAAYTHNTERFDEAVEELGELGLAERVAWVNDLAGAITPAADRSGLPDVGERPEELREELWAAGLSSSEDAGRWVNDLTTLPVITPNATLVNNSRQVVSLDRASGQRLWAYPPDNDRSVSRGNPTATRWQDMRSLAVSGGHAFAVIGECYGISETRNPNVPSNSLVCIDRQTGRPAWERESGRFKPGEPALDPDERAGRVNLQYTHFIGTPVVSHGQVMVLLRRTDNNGVHSVWVVAFNQRDGQMRWLRHLSLVNLSYNNLDAQRVSPQLTARGDTLYATDSLASVGAIDIRSGAYRWLRVLPVGSRGGGSLTADSNGVHAPPVLTRAGLYICLGLRTDRLVLVDPADGAVLRDFKLNPHVARARYVLDAGDGLLVVSEKSVALLEHDDGTQRWVQPLGPGESSVGLGGVTRGYAVVPTSQRVLVINRADGTLLDQVGDPLDGNIVLADGEVFATKDDKVYAYTTWGRASQRLAKRMVDHPEDPSSGLAIASLALRTGGPMEQAFAGIDHAMRAIELNEGEAADHVRGIVFNQLRPLVMRLEGAQQRQVLFDKLALTTQTAEQEVAYHLDYAAYLVERGRLRAAVDHLHAVMSEPAYRKAVYQIGEKDWPAGDYAKRRIESLIAAHGRGVYARYDAMALARLQELAGDEGRDTASLARLARRYPLSMAPVEALIETGRASMERGRLIDAAAMLHHALLLASDAGQRERAVGRLLMLYLSDQRPGDATRLLEHALRLDPQMNPADDQGPVSVADWQARIDQTQAAAPALTELASALGKPTLIDGRLITPATHLDTQVADGRVYLQHKDGSISRHDASSPATPRWTILPPGIDNSVYLLDDRREQALFWAADDRLVFAIDPQTGEVQWSSAVRFDSGRADPAQDPADLPAIDLHLVAVSDTVVVFGQRLAAQIVAIDRAGGSELWRSELDVTELTALGCDNWTLAAAGRRGPPDRLGFGGFALFSLYSGEKVASPDEGRINVSPLSLRVTRGRVYIAGRHGVFAVDSAGGKTLWGSRPNQELMTGVFGLAGGLIAVESFDGVLHLIDPDLGGRVVGDHQVGQDDFEHPALIRAEGAGLFVCSARGVFAIDGEGELAWRDAMMLSGLAPRRLLVGHEVVAAVVDTGAADPGLMLFDRAGGRLINRYTLGPVAGGLDVGWALLFNRGLVVPAGGKTLLIPAAE